MRAPWNITREEEADALRLEELEAVEAEAQAHYEYHLQGCPDCDDGCARGRELEREFDAARGGKTT